MKISSNKPAVQKMKIKKLKFQEVFSLTKIYLPHNFRATKMKIENHCSSVKFFYDYFLLFIESYDRLMFYFLIAKKRLTWFVFLTLQSQLLLAFAYNQYSLQWRDTMQPTQQIFVFFQVLSTFSLLRLLSLLDAGNKTTKSRFVTHHHIIISELDDPDMLNILHMQLTLQVYCNTIFIYFRNTSIWMQRNKHLDLHVMSNHDTRLISVYWTFKLLWRHNSFATSYRIK